jgi:hypothetical protein
LGKRVGVSEEERDEKYKGRRVLREEVWDSKRGQRISVLMSETNLVMHRLSRHTENIIFE